MQTREIVLDNLLQNVIKAFNEDRMDDALCFDCVLSEVEGMSDNEFGVRFPSAMESLA